MSPKKDPSDIPEIGNAVCSPPQQKIVDGQQVTTNTTAASTNPSLYTLIIPPDVAPIESGAIALVKDSNEKRYAYSLGQRKVNNVHLDCLVYEHVVGNTFRAPQRGQERYVAIKIIEKAKFDNHYGGFEKNPYIQIARMQNLNNEYVMECIEALQTKEMLFIVMPRARASLHDVIFGEQQSIVPMSIHEIRSYFKRILEIIQYLQGQGLCHRNMEPQNFLILEDQRMVISDMALSTWIPIIDAKTGAHGLMTGFAGTPAYMTPEMWKVKVSYQNAATATNKASHNSKIPQYNGIHQDLWAATVILYNLLQKKTLYERPEYEDLYFFFYILAKGLSRQPDNNDTRRIVRARYYNKSPEEVDKAFEETFQAMQNEIQEMGNDAVEIFENMFRIEVKDRWNLEQLLNSNFLRSVT